MQQLHLLINQNPLALPSLPLIFPQTGNNLVSNGNIQRKLIILPHLNNRLDFLRLDAKIGNTFAQGAQLDEDHVVVGVLLGVLEVYEGG